jgi:hypothetical protein
MASIDVDRVGFTPRTSVALTETDTDDDRYQPYGQPQDRYDQGSESISDDESNVERMLLSEADPERSMNYDDLPESEPARSEQYGDGDFSEEDFGNLQPEWPHVLSVEEVLGRRTRPLSVIDEVRSSIGSRSQASSRSKFSPSESAPPVPAIPSMYRQQPTQLEDKDPSPQPSVRSFHSRSSTDPGARSQPRSSSPVKGGGTSASAVRERIAFFEDRSASPALVQGARPGSPSGTHGLGLGLGLSRTPAPGSMFSPLSSSMLSSPYSTAQSMPSLSASASRRDEPTTTTARPSSYHSSMSSSSSLSSGPRPASPVKSASIKSYHSSEGGLLLTIMNIFLFSLQPRRRIYHRTHPPRYLMYNNLDLLHPPKILCRHREPPLHYHHLYLKTTCTLNHVKWPQFRWTSQEFSHNMASCRE